MSLSGCFPCMQKRGEKSKRVENDVRKLKCKDCNVCPYGIYELGAKPESEATSSTQTLELPSGRRTYATILSRSNVSVNLQMYFATRDNEPVALTALEAGGGGDCLFHSIAAIAEQILFERPNSRTYFEPHLKFEDFFKGKTHMVRKLRKVVADGLIQLQPEIFLNIILSSMNSERIGIWEDGWSPAKVLKGAGFAFLVTANANVVEAMGENEDGAPGDMLVRYTNGTDSLVHVLKNGAVRLTQLQEHIRNIWSTPGNTHWGTVTDAAMLSLALRLGFVIFSSQEQGVERWIKGTNMEDATFPYWGLIYCINDQHFQVAEAQPVGARKRAMYFERETLPASIVAHYNHCNNACPIGVSTLGTVI